MSQPVEIRPNIFYIGVDDHTTDLFEGLWSIEKEGVSYNSYLIRDEKIAVIDLTKEMMAEPYINQLKTLVDPARIDYIVINHIEPDHTSAVTRVRELAPNATILCSERACKMLDTFYAIRGGVQVVGDGETISLGQHSLKFYATPYVHWPETMMTYEEREQILFSCDGFGGYKTLEGNIYDDSRADIDEYINEALRYYANIVASHSQSVRKALVKLACVPIQIVAPAHGLVWRDTPDRIMHLYRTWAEYGENGGEARITILQASMYGNTTRFTQQVAAGIEAVGVPLTVIDVTRTQMSYIIAEMWRSCGILVASPTYEAVMFPPMTSVLEMAVLKKAFYKKTARIGSIGWAGGANRTFESLLCDLHWKLTDVYEFIGVPKPHDLEQAKLFGRRFAGLFKNC
jgi:anaerobic nitric oxide reductase flavorubredoxin